MPLSEPNLAFCYLRLLGRNFREIRINIEQFSYKKMHLNMSSAKWRPSCLSLIMVNDQRTYFPCLLSEAPVCMHPPCQLSPKWQPATGLSPSDAKQVLPKCHKLLYDADVHQTSTPDAIFQIMASVSKVRSFVISKLHYSRPRSRDLRNSILNPVSRTANIYPVDLSVNTQPLSVFPLTGIVNINLHRNNGKCCACWVNNILTLWLVLSPRAPLTCMG